MSQRTAASKRKQQGRQDKVSARSAGQRKGGLPVVGSSGGGGKEGLPAFFKHRKYAAQAMAARERDEINGAEADMADADEVAGSSSLAVETLQAAVQAPEVEYQHSLRPSRQEEDDGTYAALSGDRALTGGKDSSLRAFSGQLRELIASSDVLLQVLDARDPLACRSLTTETLAMGQGKRVILILNKVDLVPRENVERWLKYLRNDFTTLAFKSSTQQQRSHLAQGAGHVPSGSGTGALHTGNEALGATALLQLLKNYSRNYNVKTSLTVGIFGAPNVGKSSLINSLKRARVCGVASTPGHTKSLQSVALDKKLHLIDCPGVSFHEPASLATSRGLSEFDHMAAALRNVVKVELLEDPITPVRAILSRVSISQLEQVYDLPPMDMLGSEGENIDTTQVIEAPSLNLAQRFLLRIALRRGRLQSATGAPDLEGSARAVLHDWNIGKIKYFTNPPLIHRSAMVDPNATTQKKSTSSAHPNGNPTDLTEEDRARAAISATSEIKTTLDKEFDLDALFAGLDNPDEALGGAQATRPEMGGNIGKGSVAQSGAALEARQRKEATQADLDRLAAVATGGIETMDTIEEDRDEVAPPPAQAPVPAPQDTTTSSLGKRRRELDDDPDPDDSDSDDDEMVPSYLKTQGWESDSDDEGLIPRKLVRPGVPQTQMQEEDEAMVPIVPNHDHPQEQQQESLPAWMEKQQRKAAQDRKASRAQAERAERVALGKRAQLASVFGENELEGIQLQSKGSARKKARKQARRTRRANADGLGDLIETGLELGERQESRPSSEGMAQSKYAPGGSGTGDKDVKAIDTDDEDKPAVSKQPKGKPNAFAMLALEGEGDDGSDDDGAHPAQPASTMVDEDEEL